MKKQKKTQQADFDLATIIDINKHKLEISQQAEDRAKQYLKQATKRRKQAEKDLRDITKKGTLRQCLTFLHMF